MGITGPFAGVIGDLYFGEHPDDTPDAQIVTHSTVDNVNSGPAVLHLIEVDCTDNPQEDVYFRSYDATSATVGTDLETIGFRCRKGEWTRLLIDPSYSYGTGFTYCVTREKIGDPGTGTAPSGKVYVKGILA